MGEMLSLQELRNIFRDNPREVWREEIEERIVRVDIENERTYLANIEGEKSFPCYFLPEMLEPGYRFKYQIGDVVKLKGRDGIFIIIEYPLLDERCPFQDIYYAIHANGTSYDIIGVNRGRASGSDMGNDPIPWCSCIQSRMTLVENVEFDEGTFLGLARRLVDPRTRDIEELNRVIDFSEKHSEVDPLNCEFERIYLSKRKG